MYTEEEIYNALCIRHGTDNQAKINQAKVAVLGLGGLGSNICMALAKLGVGNMLIVDFDKVDITNIFRQNYRLSDIGEYKTSAMLKQMKEINPYLNIKALNVRITGENIPEMIRDYDIICEAFDDKETKSLIINEILEGYGDKIVVSGNGMAGYKSLNLIKTSSLGKRLYICGDMENGIETEKTLVAPRVCCCAMHEANMVLQIILGEIDI